MCRYNCVILYIHIALIVNIIPDSERLSSKVHSILVATILNKHAVVQLPFWRLLPGGIEVYRWESYRHAMLAGDISWNSWIIKCFQTLSSNDYHVPTGKAMFSQATITL